MRKYAGVLLGMLFALSASADPARYDIAPDLKTYPQSTAKETLTSVLKAVEAKRVDYVVAQLADPSWVAERVKRLYGGRFAEQVDDTRARFDPLALKQLQRFLKDGAWREDKERVSVRLKGDKRCLYFKKDGGRWFMENADK
jgi:hypothetical protein